MSRTSSTLYPFLLVPPQPKVHNANKLVERFKAHLRDLRYDPPTTERIAEVVAKRQAIMAEAQDPAMGEWQADTFYPWPPLHPDGVMLSAEDHAKIQRRARCLAGDGKTAANPYAALKKEEIDRIKPVEAGVPAVMTGSLDWADQIAADLHDRMPWMAPATTHAWHALRAAARDGGPIVLRPFLLNGPWGIGKSVWARALADHLALPWAELDASKGGVGFALAGLERGWSGQQPGKPVETILERRIINPVIIVDELCKAKNATSSKGSHFSFFDALLGLLEPATAARWECHALRLPFDMSRISWVMTSNTTQTIPQAVLSRCAIIDLPDVTLEQLVTFARREAEEKGLSEASVDALLMTIEEAYRLHGRVSLRDVNRMLERAQVLENRPTLH
ncbi:AAA family ATPase [Roseicyclus marinus]|uniref:AAA family ATPase n=1 Tax=Roseicyclus marinus TaxID=2161673 RepID=UPI00241029B5|nr:AAA family ATPase [Roseicyclus marinus]MDG3042415.1 AAA family ATPase [Roseicyclus marinus]